MFQPFKLNITYANNSPATKSNTQYQLDLTTVIPRDELLLWNRHRCIHQVDVIPGKGQLYNLFFSQPLAPHKEWHASPLAPHKG